MGRLPVMALLSNHCYRQTSQYHNDDEVDDGMMVVVMITIMLHASCYLRCGCAAEVLRADLFGGDIRVPALHEQIQHLLVIAVLNKANTGRNLHFSTLPKNHILVLLPEIWNSVCGFERACNSWVPPALHAMPSTLGVPPYLGFFRDNQGELM